MFCSLNYETKDGGPTRNRTETCCLQGNRATTNTISPLERVVGFEPTTFSLATRRSSTRTLRACLEHREGIEPVILCLEGSDLTIRRTVRWSRHRESNSDHRAYKAQGHPNADGVNHQYLVFKERRKVWWSDPESNRGISGFNRALYRTKLSDRIWVAGGIRTRASTVTTSRAAATLSATYSLVGVTGIEPAFSSSQTKRLAIRPYPENFGVPCSEGGSRTHFAAFAASD